MVSDRRTAAFSLIASGTLALVASVGLSVRFGWPDILDAPAAEVLPAFAEIAGTVQTLFLLQMAGSLVLIPGVIALHLLLARSRGTDAALLTVTAFGVLAPVIQSLGWIRWPLVVPGLAERYLDPTASAATTEATAATYELINAYAGGALGENLGWLLQGVWAVGLAILAWRAADVAPAWLRRSLAVVAVAWTVTLVPAGWLANDPLTAIGSSIYSVWYLVLLVLGVVLLRVAVPQARHRRRHVPPDPAAPTARPRADPPPDPRAAQPGGCGRTRQFAAELGGCKPAEFGRSQPSSAASGPRPARLRWPGGSHPGRRAAAARARDPVAGLGAGQLPALAGVVRRRRAAAARPGRGPTSSTAAPGWGSSRSGWSGSRSSPGRRCRTSATSPRSTCGSTRSTTTAGAACCSGRWRRRGC